MPTVESAAAELREILGAAHEKLSRISESTAAEPISAGHWSRKQVLGHLLDSASNNHHRFVRAQIEGGLEMPGYQQEAWVATSMYQERPWSELIAFWIAYNRHLAHLMEHTPESRRANPVRIGSHEPETLEFVMVDYVRHLKHHLEQILE